jgi:DNA-binding HxlR family transcriptional regulator
MREQVQFLESATWLMEIAMRTYGSFCPISIGSEIFAERWTPLIIRELSCGSHRFSQLERGLPKINKTLLTQRLRKLEQAGVVERRRDVNEYRLTRSGQELADIVMMLGDWAQRWGEVEITEKNLDPDLLMWDIHRRIDIDKLPERRIVAQIDLTGALTKSYWLVLEKPTPSVCFFDPGFDIDVIVTADAIGIHQVWMGHRSFESAIRNGLIEFDGPTELCRAFPYWLSLSVFAFRPGGRLHESQSETAA